MHACIHAITHSAKCVDDRMLSPGSFWGIAVASTGRSEFGSGAARTSHPLAHCSLPTQRPPKKINAFLREISGRRVKRVYASRLCSPDSDVFGCYPRPRRQNQLRVFPRRGLRPRDPTAATSLSILSSGSTSSMPSKEYCDCTAFPLVLCCRHGFYPQLLQGEAMRTSSHVSDHLQMTW